jgi:hypothetical protein
MQLSCAKRSRRMQQVQPATRLRAPVRQPVLQRCTPRAHQQPQARDRTSFAAPPRTRTRRTEISGLEGSCEASWEARGVGWRWGLAQVRAGPPRMHVVCAHHATVTLRAALCADQRCCWCAAAARGCSDRKEMVRAAACAALRHGRWGSVALRLSVRTRPADGLQQVGQDRGGAERRRRRSARSGAGATAARRERVSRCRRSAHGCVTAQPAAAPVRARADVTSPVLMRACMLTQRTGASS